MNDLLRQRTGEYGEPFGAQLVRWVDTALLIAVYGISHYEQLLDTRARGLAQQALDMLAAPHSWPAVLWGAA